MGQISRQLPPHPMRPTLIWKNMENSLYRFKVATGYQMFIVVKWESHGSRDKNSERFSIEKKLFQYFFKHL